MGYTTEFYGAFDVTPTLTPEHRAYLAAFNKTRRMKRNATIAATLPDPIREAAKLPIGREGGYFVGAAGFMGQDSDTSVTNYNYEPDGQPSLWCQWTPSEDGTQIEWDGGEKFYNYVEWLEYWIQHFLKPWGYTLNGEISWEGEERDDMGRIIVEDNKVSTKIATIVW